MKKWIATFKKDSGMFDKICVESSDINTAWKLAGRKVGDDNLIAIVDEELELEEDASEAVNNG